MSGRLESSVPELRVYAPEHARLAATLLLAVMLMAAPLFLPLPHWMGRGFVMVGLTLAAVAVLLVVQTRMRLNARADGGGAADRLHRKRCNAQFCHRR